MQLTKCFKAFLKEYLHVRVSGHSQNLDYLTREDRL